MNIETSLSISIWPRTICVAKKEPCPEANRCPLFEYTFYVNTQKNLNRCTCSALLLPGNKCSTPRKCSIIILPSCTAWKGLFPSTNSTEMVIFSVSKISLFKLRSATARRNTSSSFRADSSKMAPVDKEGSRKEKRKLLFSIRGLFEWKKDKNVVIQRLEPQKYPATQRWALRLNLQLHPRWSSFTAT